MRQSYPSWFAVDAYRRAVRALFERADGGRFTVPAVATLLDIDDDLALRRAFERLVDERFLVRIAHADGDFYMRPRTAERPFS